MVAKRQGRAVFAIMLVIWAGLSFAAITFETNGTEAHGLG
jgi:hypothetical protein